jgi:hypothetical protein
VRAAVRCNGFGVARYRHYLGAVSILGCENQC